MKRNASPELPANGLLDDLLAKILTAPATVAP